MKTVCKKLFSLMLVAVLLISAIPFQAFADSIEVDVVFMLNDSVVFKEKDGVKCGKTIKSIVPSSDDVLEEYKKRYSEAEDMVLVGWVFGSGVKNGERVTTSSVLSADMADSSGRVIMKALFDYPTKKITLDAKGGTVSPSTVEVKKGQTYPKLPTPTRSGYTFAGWYMYEKTLISEGDEVKNYIGLYAKWNLGTYKVTFQEWSKDEKKFVDTTYIYNVANGKTLNEHKTQNGFALPATSDFVSRYGHTVDKDHPWVDENGNVITFDTKITRDMKIRPNYKANTYTITYSYECDELANETQKVTYATKVTLKQPTRAGYVFRGWLVVQDNYKELKSGDTYWYEDITLVAQWAEKGTVELRVYRDDAEGFKTYYYSGAVLNGELDLNNCKVQNYLSGTYEFDGWYDYNGWVSYLGTKNTLGVEAASNAVTRLDKVTTSNTGSSTVTVIYGMVKGYKADSTNSNTGSGSNSGNSGNSNGNSTNNATRDPSNPATGDYMITMATTTMLVSAAAVALFIAMRKRVIR